MSELLRETCGRKSLIKLDCNWGFWNIVLHDDSKQYTAVTPHKGLFQFKVLPFGLKTSPTQFQRVMDKVFGHLYCKGLWCYIDDFIICRDDLDQVLQTLEETLKTATEAVIYFKLAKTHLFPDEADFLGHYLGEAGMRPLPQTVEGLKNAAHRNNKKELKSFSQAASFIREFVRRLSDLTAVFRPLLKKKSVWVWTDEHQEGFEELLQEFLCCKNSVASRLIFVSRHCFFWNF
eukprot:GHVN01062332.1.p1 GENE.GHVN01062332.1~~GHVN01062332.1.p1  ORF type:complete len:233 (+),score=14.95 GHVN01062332.1:1382-2080(+)